MILSLSLIVFSQDTEEQAEELKIEEFVRVKMITSKTAIYVGDRFNLKLEIIYPKDWGIEILIGDLTKNSIVSFLPEQLIIEETKISSPVSWENDEMKLIAVYQLFYPEKGKEKGILFFPEVEEQEGFKIRFKVSYEQDDAPRKDVEIYEVAVSQFVEGVRSMLTETSYQPRDNKEISRNFFVQHWLALVFGLIVIGITVYIPSRYLFGLIISRSTEKEFSMRDLLEIEQMKLNRINNLSNNEIIINKLCSAIRRLITVRAGIKTSTMTASEIKQEVKSGDVRIVKLANMLEQYDQARYSTKKVSTKSLKKAVNLIDKMIAGWAGSINSTRWQVKTEKLFRKFIEKIIEAWRRCRKWIN